MTRGPQKTGSAAPHEDGPPPICPVCQKPVQSRQARTTINGVEYHTDCYDSRQRAREQTT
jgi:hypothetical protein